MKRLRKPKILSISGELLVCSFPSQQQKECSKMPRRKLKMNEKVGIHVSSRFLLFITPTKLFRILCGQRNNSYLMNNAAKLPCVAKPTKKLPNLLQRCYNYSVITN